MVPVLRLRAARARAFGIGMTERRDHYQEPTDKIIAALEAGTAAPASLTALQRLPQWINFNWGRTRLRSRMLLRHPPGAWAVVAREAFVVTLLNPSSSRGCSAREEIRPDLPYRYFPRVSVLPLHAHAGFIGPCWISALK